MPQIKANGIALEYESFGPEDGEAILLMMGLGAQLTHWPEPFMDMLVAAGHRVIRYDTRDIGLSEKMDSLGVPDRAALRESLIAGKVPEVPYGIEAFVEDAVGMLDALGIAKAHIVGLSLGSWIAQLLAADHPERVLSLTLIAGSSGNPTLPPPAPDAMAVLSVRAPDPRVDLEGYLQHWISGERILGSKTYPRTEAYVRERAESDYRRNYHPDGNERQIAASFVAKDRRPKLKTITAPTVVMHGTEDTLVQLAAGEDLVANIPGAELLVIEHMAHGLAPELYAPLAEGILRAVSRSKS